MTENGNGEERSNWMGARSTKVILVVIVCILMGIAAWVGGKWFFSNGNDETDKGSSQQEETADTKDARSQLETGEEQVDRQGKKKDKKETTDPATEVVSSAIEPVLIKKGNTWYFNEYYLPYSGQPAYIACNDSAWRPGKSNQKFQLGPDLEIPSWLLSQRFNIVQYKNESQISWAIWPDDGGCYIHHNNPRQNEGEGLSLLISQCR